MPYSPDPGHQPAAQTVGENNVMDLEPQEAMNPSLSTIEQKTFFVHATYFFPKTGVLLAGAKLPSGRGNDLVGSEFEFSKFRQTIHFSVGSVISPDLTQNVFDRTARDRTKYQYAVIAPFHAIKDQLAEVSFVDSYVIGDLKFNDAMFLVYPKDQVITDKIRTSNIQLVPYDPSQENINTSGQRVIEQSGGWFTTILRILGSSCWTGTGTISERGGKRKKEEISRASVPKILALRLFTVKSTRTTRSLQKYPKNWRTSTCPVRTKDGL